MSELKSDEKKEDKNQQPDERKELKPKESKEDDSAQIELVAQKSIRVLPKMEVADYDKGEKLSECTDGEWDASDTPFDAQLLNVKNAPNKVSVFSGPCRSKETVEKIRKKRSTSPSDTQPIPDDRPDKLAAMMGRIFNELIDGRDLGKIKVTISTKIQVPQ